MKLRILVVDDDQDTLDVFTSAVAAPGVEVVALAHSGEAARRIALEKFDLIALDAAMPKLDGFELADCVRRSPSNHGVPILMFTPPDDAEAMRRGFALGVTFYLEKPLHPKKVRGLFAAARGVMIQQRRRYVRLPIRVAVACKGAGKHFQTRSLDISQGGMLLEASSGLAPGETVEAEFSLPGVREPLKMTAKVVRRILPDGVALEFLKLEQIARAALQLYVTGSTEIGQNS